MSIIVRFTPRRVDLAHASIAGMRARPILATVSLIFFVALPWVAAIAGVVAREMGRPVPWSTISMLVLIPLLAVPFFLLLPIFLFGRSPALRGEHTYEFADEAMHFSGPSFENKLQWDVVTRCVKSGFGFMLFSGKLPLVSIPRRALSSESETALAALFARKGLRLS